jgi:hypothetical protein
LPELENENTEGLLETLVGEGKKYKTMGDLAKAYAHADVFIEQLKLEKQQVEELLIQEKAKVSVFEKLTNPTQTETQSETKTTTAVEETKTEQKPVEDFDAKIRAAMDERDHARIVQANRAEVDSKLAEVYGDPEKAAEAIKAKAVELNLSVDWLLDVAGRSPEAFYRTVGLTTTTQLKSMEAPKSTVNVQGTTTAVKPNTYAWYQQLRRESPEVYRSAATQLRMHEDAKKPGFFD